MLTFISMLMAKVTGSFTPLIVIAVSWVLFLGLFLIIKPNRGLRQLKVAAIGGLCATVIADGVWFFKFFDNFEYLNPGVEGIAWFLLLPVLMLLAVFALSYVNSSRYIYDEKKRKELEQKEKKAKKRQKQLEKEQQNKKEP